MSLRQTWGIHAGDALGERRPRVFLLPAFVPDARAA